MTTQFHLIGTSFDDFPDEDVFYIEVMPPWMMFFDGAARREGARVGVVFVSP